uniref:Uncharacterized protein n=1 Tax=Aegilops tauschii subsp. strangulata TaxID=200361 RepID=A0A453KR74_AEGTS
PPEGNCIPNFPTHNLEAAAMGKLARLVDGIKTRLIRKKQGGDQEEASAACYDKVGKTESMRVEIRSRRAQELIAKNLAAADSISHGGAKKAKKRFFAF